MATPVFISGFEGLPSGAFTTSAGKWSGAAGGTWTVDTGTVHSGVNAFKVVTAGAESEVTALPVVFSSPAIVVLSIAINLHATPSADCVLFECHSSGAGNSVLFCYDKTAGKIAVAAYNAWAGRTVSAATLTLDVWHVIQFRANLTAKTVDWMVDGTAQTQHSLGGSAGNFADFNIGHRSSATVAYATQTCYYDDIVLSTTSDDYPLNIGPVIGYLVGNTSGTHNQTAGDLKEHGTANLTNGDATGADINGACNQTSAYVYQGVSRATTYAEYIYATSAETRVPIGVEQTVAYIGAAAGTNKQKAQLYDGTSSADAFAYVTTAATVWWSRMCWAAAPSTGAWTLAKLQACRLRWGFSDDIDPVPRLTWTYLEAAFSSIVNPAAVTATGTGAGQAVTSSVKASSATSTGTGAARDATCTATTANVNAAATTATGTGAAQAVTASVKSSAETGTGTGASNAATGAVKASAGTGAGTGTAQDTTTTRTGNAAAVTATGTGAVPAVSPGVKASVPYYPFGQGAAYGSVHPVWSEWSETWSNELTTMVGLVSNVAEGTGTAIEATTAIAPTQETATGVGAAQDAPVNILVNAEQAIGVSAVWDVTVSVGASATQATAAGAAIDAVAFQIAQAAGVGAALDASVSISAPAAVAAGTGTAQAVVAHVSPGAGVAAGLGAAWVLTVVLTYPPGPAPRGFTGSVEYVVELFDSGATFGPNVKLAELWDLRNLGWSRYDRIPGPAFFSLYQDSPHLSYLVPLLTHVRITRVSPLADTEVWNGIFVDYNSTGDDVIFDCLDYLGLFGVSRSGYRTMYATKLIGTEIAQIEAQAAISAASSPLGFVAMGTVQDPVGTDGTTPIKTNTEFGVMDQMRLQVLFDLSEMGRANTANHVTYQISRTAPFTFSLSKNAGTARDIGIVLNGTVRDYRYVPGWRGYRNNLATLGKTVGGGATEIVKSDAAAITAKGLRQDVATIKTLLGIVGAATEADQQQAATASMLRRKLTLQPTLAVDLHASYIAPFDGWDICDTFPHEIVNGIDNLTAAQRAVGYRVFYDDGGEKPTMLLSPIVAP
jgi:hypothetical protein